MKAVLATLVDGQCAVVVFFATGELAYTYTSTNSTAAICLVRRRMACAYVARSKYVIELDGRVIPVSATRHHGRRDNRKQSVYLPPDIADDMIAEARRQDRTMSWLTQKAWLLARGVIKNNGARL